MAIQSETRRAGGAAGSRRMSFLDRIDTRVDSTSRQRFQRLVAALHALGPGGLSYFLRDIERGTDVLDTLEIYAALPAGLIRAYGGDRFPLAVHVVDGGGA